MATDESTPMRANLDLTPEFATLEGRRKLILLDQNATPRDMIALADSKALETLELVEHWPSERPMPIALIENVRQLQLLLCHLENATRPNGASA